MWPQIPMCDSPGMVGVSVWPQRPMCDSPGMVGVTVVCGPRDPCAAVWCELVLCVASEIYVPGWWELL